MWAIVVVIIILFCVLMEVSRRPRNFPPGPPPLPVVGNFLTIWLKLKTQKYYYKLWHSWAEQYGDLVGLKLGYVNVVIVSGKDMIKEVYTRDVFNGRPTGYYFMMRSFGKKLGVVFSDGPTWLTNRRITAKHLKWSLTGVNNMETKIINECYALIDALMVDAVKGKPIQARALFHNPTFNIIVQLVANKRYDYDDVVAQKICYYIDRAFKIVHTSGGVMSFFPFLRYFIPGIIGYTESLQVHNGIHDFIKGHIEEHRKTLDMKNPRDIIDLYLIDMDHNNESAVSEEDLIVLVLDLIQAGLETTSSTLSFGLLYLALYEKIQKKVQKEIDDVIGNRIPTLADRASMSYVEATIMEILRISSVATSAVPHMAMENAKLGKYFIPKNTVLYLALHNLHHDLHHWKDIDVFRPERFLTKDGNIIQDEWLMPFGIGKRRCMGEAMARAEIFLFLVTLLQKFKIKFPAGAVPTTEPIEGISSSISPVEVLLEIRS